MLNNTLGNVLSRLTCLDKSMKSKKQKNALHNFLKPEVIFLSLVCLTSALKPKDKPSQYSTTVEDQCNQSNFTLEKSELAQVWLKNDKISHK